MFFLYVCNRYTQLQYAQSACVCARPLSLIQRITTLLCHQMTESVLWRCIHSIALYCFISCPLLFVTLLSICLPVFTVAVHVHASYDVCLMQERLWPPCQPIDLLGSCLWLLMRVGWCFGLFVCLLTDTARSKIDKFSNSARSWAKGLHTFGMLRDVCCAHSGFALCLIPTNYDRCAHPSNLKSHIRLQKIFCASTFLTWHPSARLFHTPGLHPCSVSDTNKAVALQKPLLTSVRRQESQNIQN